VPEQESLPPWADLPTVSPPPGPDPGHDDDAPGEPPREANEPGEPGEPREPGELGEPPREPGSRAQRGAERGAARRRRRWLITITALIVVAGGITAAVLLSGSPAPAPVTPDGLITTFQPGELQTVPGACPSVPAATVQHYLPGQVKVTSPPQVGGTAESACDWTIDQPPVYRLLQLNLLAYAPNGLASGDGSATNAAIDAYTQAEQALANPPRDSANPRAAVATLAGLGNEAFSAAQVFQRGGAVTDVATVVVRYHNVVVTVTLNGLDHSNRGSYGPVSSASLSAAALAFAQSAETALH
jgi:hypothetical protein